MHERTTRAIARWLFVACCAFPTLITLSMIVVTWTPWYHNRCITELESQLNVRTGLVFRIGDYRRVTPTSWRLDDVQVLAAETRREVAHVRTAWWIREENGGVIRLSQPEIQTRSIDEVWNLIHDRFLCRPEHTEVPFRIAADDLTLQGRGGALTMRDVDVWMRPGVDRVDATLRCVPAGEPEDAGNLQVQLSRDRSGQEPTTTWTLQTGTLRLPVAMLSEYLPNLEFFGQAATFQGTMSAIQPPRSSPHLWSLDLGGSTFDHIDLSRLTHRLPHRVSGVGQVHFDRCQISGGGGAANVAGSLIVRDGWFAASLLPELSRYLGCRVTETIDRDFGYDLLAVRFDLYAAQLKLDGICSTAAGFEPMGAGVALCAGGRPIVVTENRLLPSVHLAAAIAPTHSIPVPLSGQTMELLWILQPPRTFLPDNESTPEARVSGLKPWQQSESALTQPLR